MNDNDSTAGPPVSRRRFLLAAGGTASVGGLLGTTPESGRPGAIAIDGSPAHLPLTERVVTAFRRHRPDVPVTIETSGTADALRRFVDGTVDVSLGGRPMTAEERARIAATGASTTRALVSLGRATMIGSSGWRRSIGERRLERSWRAGIERPALVESAYQSERHRAPRFGDTTAGDPAAVLSAPSLRSDSTAVVYGDRRYQYSDGSGGAGYYEVATDEIVEAVDVRDGDAVPLHRVGTVSSRGRPTDARGVRTLTRLYAAAAIDGGSGGDDRSLGL